MGNPKQHINSSTFYGLATVGAKGQIVIPAKAREALGIESGDSLVIIGIREHCMLGIAPVSSVETMMAELAKKLDHMRAVVDESKQKSKE